MAKLTVPIVIDWESIKDYMDTHDFVEVVRCKDCKHRPERVREDLKIFDGLDLEFPDGICPCQCKDDYYSWMPKDDWFCKDGERRTDDRLEM